MHLVDVLGRALRVLDRPAPMLAHAVRWRAAAPAYGLMRGLLDHIVNRGDTAVDVGAAGGVFAGRLLRLVGLTGAVHAFEPNPAHVRRLLRLSARRRNLSVHAVALGNRSGTAELTVPVVGGRRWEGMGSLHDPRRKLDCEVDTLTVSLARLDDVLAGRRVAFIKCDVEGYEDQVFAGAERLLEQRPTILAEIEQRHRATDPRVTIDHLTSFGLQAWAIFPDGVRPASEFDLERDQLRYLAGEARESMPKGYVNNFLFTRPNVDLTAFLARH